MTETTTTTEAPLLRLNLGSGKSKIDGFLNVDLDPQSGADVAASIDQLPYSEGSVSVIYASHVLEHYLNDKDFGLPRRDRIVKLLSYWQSLLKEGGEIFIAVPDFDVLVKLYNSHQQAALRETVFDAIYGGQRNAYDFHYYGFSKKYLVSLLEEAGFKSIETFTPFANDESQHKIFGQEMSLNLRAKKAGGPWLAKKFEANVAPPDELTLLKKALDERQVVLVQQEKFLLEQEKYIVHLRNEFFLLEARVRNEFEEQNKIKPLYRAIRKIKRKIGFPDPLTKCPMCAKPYGP